MKNKLKNLMYAVPIAVASVFSCNDKNLENIIIEEPVVEEPVQDSVVNLEFDYETNFRDYFSGSAVRSELYYDSSTFGVTSYNEWPNLFDMSKEFKRSYLDSLHSSLDHFELFASSALLDSVKPVTHIHLSNENYGTSRLGEYTNVYGGKDNYGLIKVISFPSKKVVIHEMMHAWDRLFLDASRFSSSSGFWDLYRNAMDNELWRGEYASKSKEEYFAELGRYYYTEPDFLFEKDPKGYSFIDDLHKNWNGESLRNKNGRISEPKEDYKEIILCDFPSY